MTSTVQFRLLVALPAVASLAAGLLSGLARMGLPMPTVFTNLSGVHGALMIGGFFGTVIGLERAIAAGGAWAFSAPVLSGAASVALLMGAPLQLAQTLLVLSSVVMAAYCAGIWRKERVSHHALLLCAALAWLAGNIIWWREHSVVAATPLWAAFLVLTIAAERLELSRVLPTTRTGRQCLAVISLAMLGGALLVVWNARAGLTLFAASLAALAIWLLRNDVARHTLRREGLTRYMAICLLSGFVWLGVAGLLGLNGAFLPGSALRDAALHSLLLGFVFSMVFGHAPIILPLVSRLRFHWHVGLYVPLLVLHAGLGTRIAGALLEDFALRQQAAIANALTLALFFMLAASSLRPRMRLTSEGSSRPSIAPPRHADQRTLVHPRN